MRWWCEEMVKFGGVFIGGDCNIGYIYHKCSKKKNVKHSEKRAKPIKITWPPSRKRVLEFRPLATAAWVNLRNRPEVHNLSHTEL